MKSQDRHKMHRNELADWLAQAAERAKPYSNLVIGIVLLVVLGGAALVWWRQQSVAQTADAWAGFDRALATGSPAELENIAEQYPNTEVAHWAAVSAGDLYLNTGCLELFSNKSTASAALRDAVKHYRMVQEGTSVPALLERATFGLARAYEALAGTRQSQGELDKAIEAYREIVDNWPDGAYGELAAGRLKDLSRTDTKAFYDKFAQWDPRPPSSSEGDMPGTRLPFDMDSLPDDGAFPVLPEYLAPGDSEADDATTDTATEEDSSMPVEPAAANPAESGPPPAEAQRPLDQMPAEVPAESDQAPTQDQPESAATPEPPPVVAEESSDQPAAGAEEPSEPDPAVSEEPSKTPQD